MSYHIYTTEAIVLKRKTFGESDTVLYLLTKDLGLILASAKSSRSSKSKLKSGLQEYTLLTLSTVKGKNGWKVTNTKTEKNFFFELSKEGQKVLARISVFLMKIIAGELPDNKIFETVKQSLLVLKDVEKKMIVNFEILLVLRLLYHLGYVADLKTKKYLNSDWGREALLSIEKEKAHLVGIINKAMKESQL